METVKPLAGLLLIVGVMSFWIFQVLHNSRADDDALTKKINSIDIKIQEIQSEISYFIIDDFNEDNQEK
jgi:hypothetical protein